jgi:hypothetical protein
MRTTQCVPCRVQTTGKTLVRTSAHLRQRDAHGVCAGDLRARAGRPRWVRRGGRRRRCGRRVTTRTGGDRDTRQHTPKGPPPSMCAARHDWSPFEASAGEIRWRRFYPRRRLVVDSVSGPCGPPLRAQRDDATPGPFQPPTILTPPEESGALLMGKIWTGLVSRCSAATAKSATPEVHSGTCRLAA